MTTTTTTTPPPPVSTAPPPAPVGTVASEDFLGFFEGILLRPLGAVASGGNVYATEGAEDVVAKEAEISPKSVSIAAGTLTGNGEHGDGGPATTATLGLPTGLATDAAGDLYIADTEDSVVRKVDAATGVITRIAGTGVAGDRSWGGWATRSELDSPQGVAVDPSGDVFIADTINNRVVEVTRSGYLHTVAGTGRAGYSGDGGRATHAELDNPTGVALDSRGNVYIADASNNVIRRVDARTGVISTVAGDVAADRASDGLGGFSGDGGPATEARLHDPESVALNPAGDLFIADTFNNAVREVTPDGTIFTVVNAAGADGAAPPAGPEIELASGQPSTQLQLNTPDGVSFDASTGDLIVSATDDDTVSVVSGLAGSGTGPGPVAPGAPTTRKRFTRG